MAIKLGVGVLLLVMVPAVLFGLRQTSAQSEAPLFQVGQTYLFVWECVPEWVPNLVTMQMRVGGLSPCFTEALTVTALRADGWLAVADQQNPGSWFVNPARALAIQPNSGQRA